ncbi:hypothetical protein QAD02_020298 [Eretmocerus hayati]|uniref:Uncharacterized protein n=1 Tax=Eretmocerus hayati TaxID=131215 RepID=A0ACC2PNW9_9HYME|nr:hypothetical protein QAD02_020298 [Eretmocerus hayati]
MMIRFHCYRLGPRSPHNAGFFLICLRGGVSKLEIREDQEFPIGRGHYYASLSNSKWWARCRLCCKRLKLRNQVASLPPIRKITDPKQGSEYRIKVGRLINTRFGPAVVLDLEDRRGGTFSSSLPKPLSDLIRSDQQRYGKILRGNGGASLLCKGSEKIEVIDVEVEEHADKDPAPSSDEDQ